MDLELFRAYQKPGYTIGKLYVNGEYLCDTVEDEDRRLEEDASRKVYGETAIPKGAYEVRLSMSRKFSGRPWAQKHGGLVPELFGVRGFTGVRIHPGNTAADSLGCILPGYNRVKGGVVQSTVCYGKLMDGYLVPAHKKGEKITLHIH